MPGFARTFPTGGPVPAEDLVGREDVLRDLFARTFEHGNSVVLSGARQVGKTSVVDELLRRVHSAGGWGIYIDCSRTTGDEAELARLIARSTYDGAAGIPGAFAKLRELIAGVPRPIFYKEDIKLAISFYRDQAPASELLEQALRLADELASDKGKRAVVVYDEFSLLRSVSPTIFDRFRAVLQHAMANTAYVFMGSEVGFMERLFQAPNSLPFGLAVHVRLDPPDRADWKRYIEGRFEDLRLPLRPGEADDLIDFTGGHPRDLMEACEHLLTIRSLSPRVEGAVRLAEVKTFDSLRIKFDELWRRLDQPAGTQLTVARIAAGRPIYGRGRADRSVRRTIDKLVTEGVVRRTGKGSYEFIEPLFGRYVRELTA